ncbi:MAG: hypothetical protein LBC89_05605, partial [Bacteroidales bacterium]|nr:hypothetical protein [Bacteroidales bacterium]
IATVIADNYFGYSKKEVKTQISFAANLFGNAEEEHSGGAYIFPSYSQGDKHIAKNEVGAKYEEIAPMFPENILMQPEGYGKDAVYDSIFYVREDSDFDLVRQTVRWFINAQDYHIKLLPNHIYITPNGSKFRIEKTSGTKYYRLVECVSEGSLFHKSCTVSGGGKSEISKSLYDSIFQGSFYVNDFEEDFKKVNEIINRDYSDRFKVPKEEGHKSRTLLSSKRSLGSVIKLLTPTDENTDEFNAWLDSYPQHIKGLAFIVKRFYHKSWGNDWKSHFSVDILNGRPGHELKYNNKIVYARYLRVGFDREGNWRTFKLRQDFNPADKLQFEDDITASTIVPVADLEPKRLNTKNLRHSFKFVANCESRFFQRPDDAIHKGFDKKAESDLASPNTFISNFEALTPQDAVEMLEDTNSFEQFTSPMQDLIREVATKKNCDYFVCSANPRLINGKASKNVRYLQTNSMLLDAESAYITEIALRMSRKLPFDKPLFTPVTDVLPGRRNNPAEEGVRPLAVYNPLHYQELPELFMDFLASLTGKSPSTTGAGSEGALTKAPFNALLPIIDLNNALISYILTGYPGYTTPAGYIGKVFKIDHDLSLLMPEVLARMSIQEKKPDYLFENGYLEKVSDFDYKDQSVKASILGYRITQKFINNVFGRVFENPNVVFTEKMLRPELQNKDEFVEGINNIIENQKIAAEKYFKDGSINMAIPPLKALLNIMVYGEYEGLTLESPKFRKMFTYDYLIKSDFYKERLKNKQANDIWLFTKFVENLGKSIEKIEGDKKSVEILTQRLHYAEDILSKVSTPEYLARLQDTLGLNEI